MSMGRTTRRSPKPAPRGRGAGPIGMAALSSPGHIAISGVPARAGPVQILGQPAGGFSTMAELSETAVKQALSAVRDPERGADIVAARHGLRHQHPRRPRAGVDRGRSEARPPALEPLTQGGGAVDRRACQGVLSATRRPDRAPRGARPGRPRPAPLPPPPRPPRGRRGGRPAPPGPGRGRAAAGRARRSA